MILKLVEDKLENITCITSHSNPPPLISWQYGDKVLESVQKISSDHHESILTSSFPRSSSGSDLVCIVRHGAYPTGQRVVTVTLDILCRYHTTVVITNPYYYR